MCTHFIICYSTMSQGNLKSVCTTKQVYLYLNTAKRTSGTNTNAKFAANNQQWGQDRMFNFRVRQLYIPNEFFNVYKGANTIELSQGFNRVAITITPGRYSSTELLNEFKTNLLDTINVNVEHVQANGNRITWTFDQVIVIHGQNVPDSLTDSLGRTFGFPLNNDVIFNQGEPSGPYSLMLNRPNLIKVFLDLVEDNTVDNDKLTSLLDTISLDSTEYGSAVSRYYDQGSNISFDFPELRHLNSFTIRLTDQFDIPLEMPENFEVSLFLVLGLNSV